MKIISKGNLNILYLNENADYSLNKCAFFDRDGVIIKDVNYLNDCKKIKFVDGIFDVLKFLKEENFLIGIVTNQSGIARGYLTIETFIKIQKKIHTMLANQNIELDFMMACPYLKEGIHPFNESSIYRKPNPGMINEIIRLFEIDKTRSFLVGDRVTDIQCARNAGIRRGYLFAPRDRSEIKKSSSLSHEKFDIKNIASHQSFLKELKSLAI
tara:strand:- start:864 stop:1499 length:636 start_codon:yes stop_codon:yes gene_type:complete